MRDLRTPSGWFFAILGLILCLAGLFGRNLRAPLTDFNVNLYSGAAMLLFGVILLWMARRVS